MMLSPSKLILGLTLLQPTLGFVGSSLHRHSVQSSTLLRDSEDDKSDAAMPLPFSASDLQRLATMKSRHVTMPLLIMDSLVPGQTMTFESADPKFHALIEYCLKEDADIGMIGLNPHTGRPLNVGCTLPVSHEDVIINTKTDLVTVNLQAKKRFEVQGEPWLHDGSDDTYSTKEKRRDAAFYMADVELVDNRPEQALSDEEATKTQKLADQIPDLVAEWVTHLVATNRADALKMESRMVELGPLPSEWTEQALWVAALLNPTSSHDAAGEERVCLEIRPAMLSCKNDHERMILATTALQSSIDHLTGERKLF